MIYREYGKTGKKVSLVGFGAMRFNEPNNRDLCVEMVVEAAKLGINYFDTAPAYFGTKSEEILGQGFKELKRMGLPFYIATKTFKSASSKIRGEIENQLKRLNLETVDFYHIWCVTSLKNWQERKQNGVIEAFIRLKQERLIRHICVSSHLINDEIEEILDEGVIEGVLLGYSAYNFSFLLIVKAAQEEKPFPVVNGLPKELILSSEEQIWLQACWRAVSRMLG